MTNDKLLPEFREKFDLMRKELGFSSTLKELENIFFLEDFILSEGFVSPRLSRAVCRRIVDLYMSWVGYLHGIVMPNPGSMINMTEHQMFDDAERTDIMTLFNSIMALVSSNTLNGITRDKAAEARFIDSSVELWNKSVSPKLKVILAKVNSGWVSHAGV